MLTIGNENTVRGRNKSPKEKDRDQGAQCPVIGG